VPTLTGVRPRVPTPLLRFYHRHRFPVQAVALLAALLTIAHFTTRHPSQEQVLRHMADVYAVGGTPHLSKAEIETMRKAADQPVPEREWGTEETYPETRFARLRAPGEVAAVASYSDGFFTLSERRHLLADEDGIEDAQHRHSVAGGTAAEIAVLACCEGNDAPVALVLRTAPPTRVAPGWTEVTDLDLDLPDGHLALSNEGSAGQIVEVPHGRYRVRVAGMGAVEMEHDRERFRIELWPRRDDAPMTVLRTSQRR
jgi:hypothetical protein